MAKKINLENCGGDIDAIIIELQALKEALTPSNAILVENETHTRVPANTSAVILQPVNPSRRDVTVTNDGNQTLYVKKGAGVTATNWSYKLNKSDTVIIDDYVGDIYGIWSSANGAAMIVETFK